MYQERGSKIWSLTCVSVYVVGVVWMAVDALPENLVAWLAVSAMFSLVLLAFVAVPVSKYIYHRIDLTPDTLRVGRERIAVADLDPQSIQDALRLARGGSLVQPHRSALTAPEPTAKGYLVDTSRARLVGGAWGVPMGMRPTVIANRNGEQLLIASRDPQALLTALAAACGPAGVKTSS
ncbi:hypothetical protein [Streptomyces harbinensis]